MKDKKTLLNESSKNIAKYCDLHEDCQKCKLNPICTMLPMKLSDVLERISDTEETK